ncbi:hypothetical protein BGY98DRAFT_994937 [Russula aff. rugulosa BPL654]|nr:hypothetical protein BGY98DRAFT_994937 [Russula aff. rugulosa BPL654]
MKVKWCVSPIDVLPTGCQFFSRHRLLSNRIDQLDKADGPLISEAYIYLLGAQCLVSLSDGLTGYNFFSTTPSRSKNHGFNRARACTGPT